MFDPSDDPTAPREAPHVPGHQPQLCRVCGGQEYVMTDHGTQWCEECAGTGLELPPRSGLGLLLSFLAMALVWAAAITACRVLG